jgi:hypothetical protein
MTGHSSAVQYLHEIHQAHQAEVLQILVWILDKALGSKHKVYMSYSCEWNDLVSGRGKGKEAHSPSSNQNTT